VRVFTESMPSESELVRVQWREGGRRRTESWQKSADNVRRAKLYAAGVHERLQGAGLVKRERLSLRTLFERYLLARESGWRAATGRSERVRWKMVENILGAGTAIELVSHETLDELRAILRRHLAKGKRPMVPNQIAAYLSLVKRVYRFGAERRYLTPNPIADYAIRMSKDERRDPVAEYTPAEFQRILEQLNYRHSRFWRPWVAIVLGGLLGPRQRALMQLRVEDVDLVARVVRWRAETDKLGRARVQPLPREAVFALRIAAAWRRRSGYRGPWILFAVQGRRAEKPWTYQALQHALHEATRKAGIERKPFRAMHGLRRMAAKNAYLLTKSIKAAGDWIGDKDMRVLQNSYFRERAGELEPLAAGMETIVPLPRNPKGGGTQTTLIRTGAA